MDERTLMEVDKLMQLAGQAGYLHVTVSDAGKMELSNADCIAMAKWRDWSLQNSLPSMIIVSDASANYSSIAVEIKASVLDEVDVQVLVRMVMSVAAFTTFGTQHSEPDPVMAIFAIGECGKIVQAAEAIAKIWHIQEHFAAEHGAGQVSAPEAAQEEAFSVSDKALDRQNREVNMQEWSFTASLVMAVAAVIILDLCLVILAVGLGIAVRAFMVVAGL